MKKRSGQLDWTAAHRRLEQIRQLLDDGSDLNGAEVANVFRERAGRLRKAAAAEEPARESDAQLLVFRQAGERYALPIAQVGNMLTDFRIALIPEAPPRVHGVVQIRGDILPVYRLRRPGTEMPPDAGGECAVLLVLKVNSRQFCICVESVEEIRAAGDESAGGSSMTEDLVTIVDNTWWGE